MASEKIYCGIDADPNAGMHHTGNIIRDAWVFGLLDESDDGKGWSDGRISELYDRVSKAWEPYGHLPSALPEELRERHARIYADAIKQAKARGWDPEEALNAQG